MAGEEDAGMAQQAASTDFGRCHASLTKRRGFFSHSISVN
jgi:hypothetical protein